MTKEMMEEICELIINYPASIEEKAKLTIFMAKVLGREKIGR